MSDVQIDGVTMSFGARRVLTGVNLTVPTGSVTAVLGPSGCGKSTLLRILAGFQNPSSGVVSVDGEVLADGLSSVPAHRRRIGLMPQEGALFPHLSVADNVAFGLGRMPRSARASVVRRWLQAVGLDGLGDSLPHQVSGGQQQRVALARALAAQPRVLLLDEPFAALDAGLRVQVREDITSILREAGTTAVLVTHDQAEALSLADQVAVLLDGSIAQSGAPHDLYWRPTSLAVSRFVGSTIELAGRRHGDVVRTALGEHAVSGGSGSGDVTVVLRPEQVRITDGDTAVVSGGRFYGPEAAVRVTLADGTSLDVRQPGNVAPPADGAAVGVHVDGGVLAFD
ncbi:ABC transporter ATP-binding protein [Mycobacterium sp. MS1601]|uniref:ABC transporter ATP-binding protein n=1 Tax=Mycobacterium sp. MS1601 TaxID=1936029 RepID=UPI0009791884|nr:ABC transporter ATP-binding protein [Mycobacterium sp. MS1601]AQA01330.1 ABC transporter ATP-binding protein [Mycobacterium sp. MS1601]